MATGDEAEKENAVAWVLIGYSQHIIREQRTNDSCGAWFAVGWVWNALVWRGKGWWVKHVDGRLPVPTIRRTVASATGARGGVERIRAVLG